MASSLGTVRDHALEPEDAADRQVAEFLTWLRHRNDSEYPQEYGSGHAPGADVREGAAPAEEQQAYPFAR